MSRAPAIERRDVEDLYRRFGALVRRRARGILGDENEAQDAMHEVFVRVIRSMAEFRGQSQPSTWLYRITTNVCLNRIRDGRRRRERMGELADARAVLPSGAGASPEARPALQALLRLVPEDLAQAAVYHYVDEMDHAEIAAIVGVSRRTIGYRLDRFREQAQALLRDERVAPAAAAGVKKAEGDNS